MKLIIDIQDNKASAFMEMLRSYTSVATTPISEQDAELLEEIKEIRLALKHADEIKTGKLKGRPVEELLREL